VVKFMMSILKICAASTVMGVFLALVRTFGAWTHGLTGKNLFILGVSILFGVIIFGIFAYLFRCEQIRSIRALLKI